jgi:prevent-host-death family protein
MAIEFAIRDLRNDTRAVISAAQREGEVFITNHGERVARLSGMSADTWPAELADLLDSLPDPRDSGLAALLADDDEQSRATEHL